MNDDAMRQQAEYLKLQSQQRQAYLDEAAAKRKKQKALQQEQEQDAERAKALREADQKRQAAQEAASERVEALYGPQASHSDYARGDRLRFMEGKQVVTGTILWVCAEATIAGRRVPLQYAVEVDGRPESFPEMVVPAHIVQE